MDSTTMKILQEYEPEKPYCVEIAKDLLALMGREPSDRNGLMLCYIIEKGVDEK